MIVIQGMVGAGKSTLSEALSARERLTLFPEPVESNPYLEKFYENPERYAFQMQVFLLHARFEQTLMAQNMDQCIMDMSMYGNDIFVSLQHLHKQITWEDYQTYAKLSSTLKKIVKPPDLMVYLKCSPRVAINRIMKRNRAAELNAPIKYWYDLHTAYEKWYHRYNDSKKIAIDVNHLDFANEDDDQDYIIDLIMEAL